MGSNLGDRQANLDRALGQLGPERVAVKRVSSVWETEPVGVGEQPWFLNLAAEAETELFPTQLLDYLQEIEFRLGRRRTIPPQGPQGPRTIDIDILLYDSVTMQSERLTIPHPRLAERRFVLEPLAELAPDLRHPVTHLTVREMLAATSDHSHVRLIPK